MQTLTLIKRGGVCPVRPGVLQRFKSRAIYNVSRVITSLKEGLIKRYVHQGVQSRVYVDSPRVTKV